MALPKLTTPTYELEIPSTDEKISYRPFLVKEEKILLMAMESGKNEDIVNAVEQIVSECTFNKMKIGTMPMFDVEYLFLNIRAKSVGEISKVKVLCLKTQTFGQAIDGVSGQSFNEGTEYALPSDFVKQYQLE